MSDKQFIFERKELALPCFSDFDAEFVAFNVEFSTNATATCICCLSHTAQFIQENWENVVHEVNYDYITTGVSEFELWNVYLVFASKKQLDTETQYKLENNKYAMRKLFIKLPDDLQLNQSEQVLSSLLSNKLLIAEVNIKPQQEAAGSFTINEGSIGHRVCELKLTNSRVRGDADKRKQWLKEEMQRRLRNED
ncbi:hypothetical protein BM524_13220 [Alteromonas mediterranea]|uniref:Uncharacterized protein n=1 Tax=Alteromonas mediterranea TaxID=314275 RepID=A0AAC9JBN6_9ALTE|nr:ABC-three component system middle component 1 [Alteromonas mediterranea]APD90683.1 hypothetical protein BM524_13220 [Alteromonas mediterranea]